MILIVRERHTHTHILAQTNKPAAHASSLMVGIDSLIERETERERETRWCIVSGGGQVS